MDNKLQGKLDIMKRKVTEAKDKKTKLEGKLEQLMTELPKYDCETLEEADTKLEEMTETLDTMEPEIKEKITSLTDNYDWS